MSEALNRDKTQAAIFWGAHVAWCNKGKTLADNPFPDLPGYYMLRRAWAYGFKNSEAVIREVDGEDD